MDQWTGERRRERHAQGDCEISGSRRVLLGCAYNVRVLWHKRRSPPAAPDVPQDIDEIDNGASYERRDGGMTQRRSESAPQLRDLAQRLDDGGVQIAVPRIETVDDSGHVVDSRPVRISRTVSSVDGPSGNPVADLEAGRALGVGDFVSIDFETATSSRSSACAVGLATVTSGRISDVQRWLIRPPGNEYAGFNISIHGITPAMTEDAPTFGEVWSEVMAFVGDQPLVAHYAALDFSVLRNGLTFYGNAWPDLTYFCTWSLARRAWPGRLSYRLVDLADECGLAFDHHEPGADASTAAELAIACCGFTGERCLTHAGQALGVFSGRISQDGWTSCGTSALGQGQHLSDIRPTVDFVPDDSPFLEKTVVFTGTLTSGTRTQVAQLVVNAGGYATESLSRKVDFLVLGMQDARRVKDGVHSGKMLKAGELQASGSSIELLSEDEFLRMLPG